ncbi:glycogen debranching protein GlgX [Glutamicibacter halophytocola]|uniref:Glycogen debranching protein GlgX n=1 Tax=Glutamicibacter halophytocola TaxID=1933880 RepID=A0AA95BRI2_9MICC|nr:glycogen debranching protein GlgX [Glutamicibacter halophytocola]UUX57613.1 glycogen debranching protein GlgX [Glutamicibacter halophytocola]
MAGAPAGVTSAGRPWPLGVTVDSAGVNVAVYAPAASALYFCLFPEGDQQTEQRLAIPYRQDGIWHAHFAGLGAGARYGLRADGEFRPADGLCFNVNKLLIDPYARSLDRPVRYHELMNGTQRADNDDPGSQLDPRDSAAVVPKCIVAGPPAGPDPASNRPGHDLPDLVIYETHLKGISAAHPEVPAQLRGTYAGMGHPAVIEHLRGLGVTAVELLPVQAFFDDEHIAKKDLHNYWGYQPVAWFAPEPRYAQHDAVAELRQLVHVLHEAGIEVILDVVYNHSGEGGADGPTLNLRGLDNTGYYRLLEDKGHYANDSGTGNTLAVHSPMVLRMVLDSLRYWAQTFGVDGFRFDLATAVARGPQGFDTQGAFLQAIAQDPVLATLKLIAEPWDLGPGGYQLGNFPAPFAQWNDQFRDGVRRAWRGDVLGQANFGALLLGSANLFDHSGRSTAAGINFISAHDGFTLHDMVSYSHKHNEANGEDNRDGHDENYSDNFGVEGPANDPAITEARGLRVRGMLATLLLAQGVPMLLAGDELGNSQRGNNNAYAQDNELGWLDWSAPDRELMDYVRRLIDVRRRLPLLRQRGFLHGQVRANGLPDVRWLCPDGSTPTAEHWQDPDSRALALQLRGGAHDPRGEALDGSVMIIFNLGGDCEFQLPGTGGTAPWLLELDSALPGHPAGTVSERYAAKAQSVVVLSCGG